MYVVATFKGDDNFSQLIKVNLLEQKLQDEIKASIARNPFGGAEFAGDDYWTSIQKGVVTDPSVFPLTIHGFIDIYLE